VDIHDVRRDPAGAVARGHITIMGSKPIAWAQVRQPSVKPA